MDRLPTHLGGLCELGVSWTPQGPFPGAGGCRFSCVLQWLGSHCPSRGGVLAADLLRVSGGWGSGRWLSLVCI